MPTPLFHNRPLLFAAAGLLLGTVLSAYLHGAYAYAAAAILLVTAGAAAGFRKGSFALAVAFACLGLMNVALRELEPPPTGENLSLSGRVCETPVENASGWTVTLDGASVDGMPVKGRVRLLLSGNMSAPAYGQRVQTEVALRLPEGVYANGDRYRGIVAIAFSKYGGATYGEVASDPYGWLLDLRARVGERILALFPAHGGIAKAMLLGDKSDTEEGELAAFRETGILHLMAVSGLHTGILAGAFGLLFRRNPWVRFCAVGLFLLLYAALTAFSPSVLRASVMVLCGSLARPLRRKPDTVNALSLAFLLLVLVRPRALFYVGFQLSFCAVLGMLTLTPVLYRFFGRLGDAFGGLLAASVGVTVATASVMALQFQAVNLTALLTNLLVIPLAPLFLVPGALAVVLSFLVPAVGALLARAASLPLGMLVAVARAGGEWSLPLPPPSAVAILLCLAGCVLLSPLCLRPPKTRALLGGSAWVAGLLFWLL